MAKQKTENPAAHKAGDVKTILGITLKLFIISTVTALMLSGVNALTADKIAENERAEKAAAIAEIFPGDVESTLYEVELGGIEELYVVSKADTNIGYAAQVNPLGFGGEMTVMVGVNADGTLAGVKLISHSETPGLGNRVGEPEYLAQYIGKGAESLNGGIDVITGSTISSEAILDGVNSALAAYSTVFAGIGGSK
ncbi:MAG: RnfABCDGE type electron transport complex subunit G [Clostridia bacterium]|nr:RnfABCDGE type electron transport complex subunit G [Clostridia bacterium]